MDDARNCGSCGLVVEEGLPDPCIGHIDGVSAACCGHGDPTKAYVAFYMDDGSFVAWDGGFTFMDPYQLRDAEAGIVDHG